MNRLESCISNKRILMIGGSFSSEDLALQCTKLGAGEIYITSRHSEGVVMEMGCWPKDNVKVMEYRTPCGIKDGNTILFRTTYYDDDSSDEESDDDDSFDEPEIVEVENVDVIVCCTGYQPNVDFMDQTLNPFLGEEDIPTWKLPKDWMMKPNMITQALGHVQPSKKLRGWCNDTYMGENELYGVLLMRNPNMMYLMDAWFETPLFEIDVNAYGCMGYIMGEIEIPSEEVMREETRQFLVEQMNSFSSRYNMDENFYYAIWEDLPRNHFLTKFLKDKIITDDIKKFSDECTRKDVVDLIAYQKLLKHPVKLGSLNDNDEEGGCRLNDKGELYVKYVINGSFARWDLQSLKGREESKWKTFRDITNGAPSMFTGTKPTPLNGRWMDLDNEGKLTVSTTGSEGEQDNEEKKE